MTNHLEEHLVLDTPFARKYYSADQLRLLFFVGTFRSLGKDTENQHNLVDEINTARTNCKEPRNCTLVTAQIASQIQRK